MTAGVGLYVDTTALFSSYATAAVALAWHRLISCLFDSVCLCVRALKRNGLSYHHQTW